MDTSYLSQQVTTIIERLHGFFDEIGVASHERDSRESEVIHQAIIVMPRILTAFAALLRSLGNTTQSAESRRKGET